MQNARNFITRTYNKGDYIMFGFVKNDNGENNPIIEMKPAAAATYGVGETLKVNASTGYVEKTYGTNKPEYISAFSGAVSAGAQIAVNPVYKGQTWQTTFAADGSALKVGAKVTIHTDSAQVTATTTSGVATLVANGAATGGMAIVKFE
jgi:1-aminocyclopropane-1-carboxylate deaminase/D-cysteine desulfhydrase-like pyridoxal-dependent ACC family enzyme